MTRQTNIRHRLTRLEDQERQTMRKRVLAKLRYLVDTGRVSLEDVQARWPNLARKYFSAA